MLALIGCLAGQRGRSHKQWPIELHVQELELNNIPKEAVIGFKTPYSNRHEAGEDMKQKPATLIFNALL